MTNQLQGETLYQGITGSDYVYTPWFPVKGDVGTFGVQVLAVSSVTLTWGVETRTTEDPTVSNMITGETLSATGSGFATSLAAGTVDFKRAKQLVRYKFQTGATASTADFVTFRALQPSWQVNR